ncbi:MAG: type II toxin-antitoxin system RelE/ParE family toxin [Oscillospiraceae bacterium]|jgi:phage-related protein|nr:type II toxin-antitoxin system RelE/ParE family toxin [Oscillospiraceae bacterium]
MYEIILFEKGNGDKPAEEFLNSLDKKMRTKMVKVIEKLADNGPKLGRPHSAYLRDGILELRAQSGSNITRVLYFFIEGKTVVLTHGFIKKTQEIPPNEIEKAKKYRDEYRENRRNLL